ncbi:MAG: radical SAM protein [Deltaproteobacteria bacterium]|nr:radical SAM protein [Deltaproteobacteria bacterium]
MANKDSYSIKVSADDASLWKVNPPLLESLDMELTERCNNNCIHCYINLPTDDLNAKKKELSTEEIQAILQEAVSLGCLTVRFTGGEPLLREDFEDLYSFARKLGLRVALFTNATLITAALAKVFVRTPPLMPIEITLYGMTRNSYETITRVPGSFKAAWRGINLLLEYQVPFVVTGVLLPPNREEIEEFESWATTIPWMYTAPSYSILFDLRARRDSKQKNQLIKGLRLTPEDAVAFLSRKQEKYLQEMREFCVKFTRPQGNNIFSCGAGIRGGCVDAYGYFQPCMLLRHPDTVYDLKKGSLKDALKNFFPKIRNIKTKNTDYLNRCARCVLQGLCEQCPARSWMEHGTLDTPVEYQCEIAHAQATALGLLEEGERAWEIKNWKERIRNFSGGTPTYEKKKPCKNQVMQEG